MIVKPRRKPGVADVSDLSKNEVVRWQHRWYVWLILLMGFGVPTVIPVYFGVIGAVDIYMPELPDFSSCITLHSA
jgi:fatty-acid desaturase